MGRAAAPHALAAEAQGVRRPRGDQLDKSEFAERLDLVQTQFSGVLRPLGFRRSGRTYNRTTPEGLVQVINLQISRPDPVPPQLASLREAGRHDKFTVNLGVWVPEVSKYHGMEPRSKTIQDYDSHVRARLGQFATPPSDLWWALDEAWPACTAKALALLQAGGLPFLERMGTRDGIVAEWLGRAPDSRIVVAIIEARRGRPDIARHLLAAQIASTRMTNHHAYVRVVAKQLELGELPP